jgi:hypothetical protein
VFPFPEGSQKMPLRIVKNNNNRNARALQTLASAGSNSYNFYVAPRGAKIFHLSSFRGETNGNYRTETDF